MTEENGQQSGTFEVATLAKDDDEDVVELTTAEVSVGAGTSVQTPDLDTLWTPGDCIAPPESLHTLQELTEFSSIRNTSLWAMVRNTVGLGWDVDTWPHHDDPGGDPDERVRQLRWYLDLAARRDTRLDKPGLYSLMEAVNRDRHEIGTGYIEVSRNRRTGLVDGLYYLPGLLVRRKRDRTGYVMGQHAESVEGDPIRTEYVNFGEKVVYEGKADEMEPTAKLAPGVGRWKVNEVIALREYTPRSRDYGLPRDYALAVEYAAARFAQEYTASFFQGSGTPARMIFVQGESRRDPTSSRVRFTIPRQTMNRIDSALRSDAKPGDRVVVIPVPPGTQVDSVDLGELSDRDLTFLEFKKMHRRHVAAALGPLSPIFVGDVEDAGRYTAEVQRSITLEQVFDPDQRETEDKLWPLLRDMGFPEYRLKFKRLAVEGDAVRRESANNMAEVGAITMGEYREAHGYGSLPAKTHGEDANDEIVQVGSPRGAENRVAVEATEDQRGLRPGIGARVAKGDDHAEHGVTHVEKEVDELAKELEELAGDPPAQADDS